MLAVNDVLGIALPIVVLIPLGLWLILTGRRLRAELLALEERGVRTTAEVVHAVKGRDAREHVIFRFQDAEGTSHDVATMGAHIGQHEPGETATIIYDPEDPRHVTLEQLAPKGESSGLILEIAGVTVLVAAALSLYFLS
jgi:hypothetical protein